MKLFMWIIMSFALICTSLGLFIYFQAPIVKTFNYDFLFWVSAIGIGAGFTSLIYTLIAFQEGWFLKLKTLDKKKIEYDNGINILIKLRNQYTDFFEKESHQEINWSAVESSLTTEYGDSYVQGTTYKTIKAHIIHIISVAQNKS